MLYCGDFALKCGYAIPTQRDSTIIFVTGTIAIKIRLHTRPITIEKGRSDGIASPHVDYPKFMWSTLDGILADLITRIPLDFSISL